MALFIRHNDPTATIFAVSTVKVSLCGGAPVNVSTHAFHMKVMIEPLPTSDCSPNNVNPGCGPLSLLFNSEMDLELYNGSTHLAERVLDSVDGLGRVTDLPVGQWVTLTGILSSAGSSDTTQVTDIEIFFRTYNQPWIGNFYFDDIRIQ
jgi:hypothetical protein